MSDDLHAEAYRELQREYLAELPTAIADLRQNIEAFRRGEDVVAELRTGFHRLAGSGGSYGFPEISEIARAAEQSVASSPPARGVGPARRGGSTPRGGAHRRASAGGRRHRGGPHRPARGSRPPGWRGAGPGDGGARRRRIRRGPARPQGGSAHGDRRPAGGSPGDRHRSGRGRPSAVASSWTSRRSTRPRAVILIETLRAVDRLRAVAAGVDGVFPAERMVADLPRYARTLAQSGPPPSTVLLLDGDADRSSRVVGVLEPANIRVVRSPSAKAARGAAGPRGTGSPGHRAASGRRRRLQRAP